MTINRLTRSKEDEGLTGIVQGQKASDLEERWARSHYRYKIDFRFQYYVRTAVGLPNEDKIVDFISDINGSWQAFEIDGEIGHKTQEQQEYDDLRDVFVNEALEWQDILPIERIKWDKLETQEMCDRTFREYL